MRDDGSVLATRNALLSAPAIAQDITNDQDSLVSAHPESQLSTLRQDQNTTAELVVDLQIKQMREEKETTKAMPSWWLAKVNGR